MDLTPAVTHPVVVVGVGPRGNRVARELELTAAVRPSGAGMAATSLGHGPRAALLLRRSLEEILGRLLEAGRVQGARVDGRARLDLVIAADLAEVEVEEVVLAADTIAALLVDSYGVLFPPDTPEEERSAWMGVVLATPALMPGAEGERAARALLRLESWAESAPHPALSRIWLLPRQTTAGQLSDGAVEQSMRLLAQALYLSGVREHDEVRARLAHRRDSRWLATASVAAAELPVARLRQYARWRAAWDGFTTLVRQAEQPSRDQGRAASLLSRIEPDDLLSDLEEGRPAQLTRRHAAELTGLSERLPDQLAAGLLEADASVRQRYPMLFERAEDRRPSPQVDARDHTDVIRALDEAEIQGIEEAERRVNALLAEELDPSTALQVLPDIEAALDRALIALEPVRQAAPPPLPRAEPSAPPQEPGREALEAALRARPRLAQLLPVAAALALVLGVLASSAVLALSDPAVASTTAPGALTTAAAPLSEAARIQRLYAPLTGLLVGLLGASTWTLVLLYQARTRLLRKLRSRRFELEALWSQGGPGLPGRQAAALLEVRRRRTAEGTARVLLQARERLDALRAALRSGRTRALTHLDRLEVRLGDAQRRDDLRDLLGDQTPLHHPLLPAPLLAERIAQARTTQDPDRWAQLLLESTWPSTGIATDLPAMDDAPLTRACDAQIRDLGASRLLQGPEVRPVVEQRLSTFLDGVSGALAFGIRPRDEHGDPVRGTGLDRPLVVAPMDLRVVVDAALSDQRGRFGSAWGTANTPWVVVLHTREGFRASEIIRGMGVSA